MPNWEQAESRCRKLLQTRMRLLPYLYSAYMEYHDTGKPPARALVLDYPADRATWTIDDQYMLGPALMVAPLFTGETKRTVYLPKGDWYDFWTHAKHSGGQTVEIDKSVEEIPVFVKAGTLLPLAEPVECVRPDTQFAVTVQVVGTKPRKSVLYEDDGTTFDFQKGKLNRIELNWNGETGTATRSGGYTGPGREYESPPGRRYLTGPRRAVRHRLPVCCREAVSISRPSPFSGRRGDVCVRCAGGDDWERRISQPPPKDR